MNRDEPPEAESEAQPTARPPGRINGLDHGLKQITMNKPPPPHPNQQHV
jgi:hypothetical protein